MMKLPLHATCLLPCLLVSCIGVGKPSIELDFVGRYQHLNNLGMVDFDVSAAEIPAFDERSKRIFVVNAQRGGVDVLNAAHPSTLSLIQFVDVAQLVENARGLGADSLGAVNSVSICNGVAAVAVEANPKTNNGYVAFINCATLAVLGSVEVGALPDMLTFTPDGTRVVVANEGEPTNNYTANPPGSVSIISLAGGYGAAVATHVGFTAWDVGGPRASEVASLRAGGLRFNTVSGAVATFSQDMEPEYIAINARSSTAYVTLQENNAYAVIDLASATVTAIHPFGFKDHGQVGNELDVSDRDVDGSSSSGGKIDIRTWPGVVGAYMPDSIAAYEFGNKTYLVTANEGDSRDYGNASFQDEMSVKDFVASNGPLTGVLAGQDTNDRLNRLTVVKDLSTSSRLVAFGARSFSIWDADSGARVYDSGSDMEQLTAALYPNNFNASSTNNTLDNRSDNKGPEPEGVCIGKIGNKTYAFIGLERIGGIMIYDISNPHHAKFVSYRNDRTFMETPGAGSGGDLAPEGLVFVPADKSPTRLPLLIVGYETSGTTVVYEIGSLIPPHKNG